ncbi:LacI family DNA-binding transcriptional regulator [Cyclobacterium jeungdonense]|uniref:LacI family DNA-binding transcriptional regulator n=1 Tax=Cyclobacterium jeungdonense TaxID=708087 RepID=A0ABT8C4B9_9BACT|nr:LacI family DNA-binding transcriptional regulator [Cyclobacterium jeungdonense]MDN3687604.1 LacI family DNA-binding transcriptional regulator [Cyclobacterium jeungdonense]
MKRRHATLSDIAKALNVSASTVSRALHDSPLIRKETKDSVIAMAKALNYQPNQQAIGLLNKKTKIIGVIVPEITGYFFATAINGLQDFVENTGYKLIIGQSNESFDQEAKLMETLSLARVDGLIISPTSETTSNIHLEKFRESGIPVVVFDRDCPNFLSDKVFVDDYEGAFQAVDYLIKTGCRKIAHLGGPANLTTCRCRKRGYLDALTQNGITPDPQLILEVPGFTPDCGEEIIRDLLDREAIPDAIFAVNDAVAIGTMPVILEKGLRIPQDISLIGFDDEPYSQYFMPSLTTVWQPVYELGLLSGRILMNHILHSPEEYDYRYELLKPELIVRQSSKPLV